MQSNIFPLAAPLILIPLLLFALWRIGLRKLKSYHSPLLGKIEVLQKYNGEKILTTNSYIQGISTEKENVSQSYWYCVAKQTALFCKNYRNPQILMLGLGANTIPNLIAKINPEIHQTIVEIDDSIISACKEFFGLDKLPNYKLIQADAFKLIGGKNAFEGKKFDVAIVDVFIGSPPYVSIESNQPNFIEKLLPYLKKEGAIIFNRPGHTEMVRADSRKLENYLKTLFTKTQLFDVCDPRGFRNSIITGQVKKQ